MLLRGLNRLGLTLRAHAAYGSEYKNLIKLGLPVMVTQIGVVVVSFADTIMVGRCGTPELGAAAFVNAIFMVAIVMQFGFSGGLTPIAGALFSSGDSDGVGATAKAGLIVNVAVSVAFTIILGIFYFFIGYLGQPAELLPLIRPYYLVMLCTLVPMAIFNSFQQISNGCTDTALPMWLVIGSNILNIFGNWVLIWGKFGFPELGLLGAGISTLCARVVGMSGMVAVFAWSRKRGCYREGWRKNHGVELRGRCSKVWKTSYPVMFQSGIECFMWSLGGVVSGWFGTIQLASYQVVNTIAQLGYMIYMGFGVATSIRVANYIGIREYGNAGRIATAGLHLILGLAVVACAVFVGLFRPLVEIFTPDMAVVAATGPLLIPLVLYQFGDAVQITYVNAQRGTGRVKPLFRMAVLSYIVLGAPFMLLLAVGFGLKNVGVYYSFTLALMTMALTLALYFRKTLRDMPAKGEK